MDTKDCTVLLVILGIILLFVVLIINDTKETNAKKTHT